MLALVRPPCHTFEVSMKPSQLQYDFDALVFSGGRACLRPSILTFAGDRERCGLPSHVNAFLIENDVWQFSP